MKINKKLTKALSLICIIAIVLTAFSSCSEKLTELRISAMGKEMSVVFYSDDTETSGELFSAMSEAVKKAGSELYLSDENSEISLLNSNRFIYATDSFKKTLKDVIIVCTALGDSVDFTIGKAVKLWGFGGESPSVPDSKKLGKAAADASIDKVKIAGDTAKISIEKDILLDMTAMQSGIACDRAAEAVRNCNIPYILRFGDTAAAYGEGPYDGKWEFGVKNPFSEENESFAVIKSGTYEATDSVFIAASGCYEDKFEKNGRSYHRILDPLTGYPADNEIAGVTVIADSGLTADALSEALVINGFSDKSLLYLKYFSAEAVFVFRDKTYYVTEGLRDSIEVTDSSFTLHKDGE